MKNQKINASILISIFKRKGGEGEFTKLISSVNKFDYEPLMSSLFVNELPLIAFKKNNHDLTLISDQRVIVLKNDLVLSIDYKKMTDVSLALVEEFRQGVISKLEFTRIVIVTDNKKEHIIQLEKGPPLQGIYQLLNYVAQMYSRG